MSGVSGFPSARDIGSRESGLYKTTVFRDMFSVKFLYQI